MLTITTTRTLAALRQRAKQAEGDLADATRQLEEFQQRSETGQDQPQLPAYVAALREELEAAHQLADEAMASEARTKSASEVMRLDATKRLAAQQRTIAELRAELEQACAAGPAGPELPEHTALAFRTLGGSLVALIAQPDDNSVSGRLNYSHRCLGCGDEAVVGTHHADNARRRANEHAAECRAIPSAAFTRI
ncbi:hypothetical protein Kpho02_59850 [Kitasatospora phosalacinea]|uniref:Uncharacterized protein n=1 Tax=Kitasatospora phosalacinea TaxID=2065 RepID=A0A9W6QBD7_9ACTN|nr:hypothetical protein [Kitasatospora phosalacinea]GLW73687.1 hypothetical protein Kpho02_59850 [Kitasatospora phosalacinea]